MFVLFCFVLLGIAKKGHVLFIFTGEKCWAGEVAPVRRSGELLLGWVSLNLCSAIRKEISSRQAPSYQKNVFDCFLRTAN